MKNFKLLGMGFECDEKYNYATVDEDGSFWVYTEDPFLIEHEWDTHGEMHQVFPVVTDDNHVKWDESKIEI